MKSKALRQRARARVVLAGLCALQAGTVEAAASRLYNVDVYRSELPQQAVTAKAAVDGVLPSQFDGRMGKTTFLWADASQASAAVGALKADTLIEAQARQYLRDNAAALHLTEAMIAEAAASDGHYNGAGAAVVRFAQRVNGMDVFNRSLNVMIDRSGRLVAISGYFATDYGSTPAPSFARTAAQSVVSAWQRLGGGSFATALLGSARTEGAYQWFQIPALIGNQTMSRAPRVKPVYYAHVGRLEPAYYVEIFGASSAAGDIAYSQVVSGSTGSLLFRKNLSADVAYNYRVFADASGDHAPYDSPLGNGYAPFPGTDPFVQPARVSAASRIVSIDHGPIANADPWIAASGETETTANATDAYIDSGIGVFLPLVLPVATPGDGYVPGTGDSRATATSTDTFDYAIAGDDDPSAETAQHAANVNLFYVNNWLHDAWYDHGFDEVAGNAQTSNFERGGVEGDAIKAEGQDASGRNNANMATPGDGSSPRMQMYLFDGAIAGEVRVTEPASIGAIKFNGASFGPKTFDVEGEAAVANDLFAPETDGCTGLSTPADPLLGLSLPVPNLIPDPNLIGKIAIIDRGNCNFTNKAQFASVSGAIALVVVNNGDGDPTSMGNADVPLDIVSTDELYQIPSIMIRKDDGDALKAAIAAGQPVTMTLRRDASIDRDGTLDNQVIAHEYFHYVSNRLVEDGSGLSNNQGGSMGEGWSDVAALILSVRPEDKSVSGNTRWQGAYGMGHYVTGDAYFGIRRTPYSTDFAKNPLTFKHIEAGVALPAERAPIAYGTDGSSNAEVHAAGEVWANAVWQCYAGMLNNPDRTFADARSHMMDYIIAGLKMTPASPTFTEARDGILAAAMAANEADYLRCAHGFAVRGMGKNAVSPDRDSDDHVGVVEDFTEFGVVPNDEPSTGGGGGSGGGGSGGGSGSSGGGGGALGGLLLMPMMLAAMLRRRRM